MTRVKQVRLLNSVLTQIDARREAVATRRATIAAYNHACSEARRLKLPLPSRPSFSMRRFYALAASSRRAL